MAGMGAERQTKQDERERDRLSPGRFKGSWVPGRQFTLVMWAQLSRRAPGRVHPSPKQPGNPQLCTVAPHFLLLFQMILYFHVPLLEISFALWRQVITFISKFISQTTAVKN